MIELSEISGKNILIKTFLFESGLWYLAKSLGDMLEGNDNNVYYMSKARYALEDGMFIRKYPKPKHKNMLDGLFTYEFATVA